MIICSSRLPPVKSSIASVVVWSDGVPDFSHVSISNLMLALMRMLLLLSEMGQLLILVGGSFVLDPALCS